MLFELFKQILSVSTTAPSFKASNTLLQDISFATGVANHLATLSQDYNIRLTSVDVLSVTDWVTNEDLRQEIVFLDPNSEGGESPDPYDPDSVFATFISKTFAVPITISGFLVQSDLPQENVQVEYRTSLLSPWRILLNIDNVPGSTFLQFRVKLIGAAAAEHTIKQIIIIGKQE